MRRWWVISLLSDGFRNGVAERNRSFGALVQGGGRSVDGTWPWHLLLGTESLCRCRVGRSLVVMASAGDGSRWSSGTRFDSVGSAARFRGGCDWKCSGSRRLPGAMGTYE